MTSLEVVYFMVRWEGGGEKKERRKERGRKRKRRNSKRNSDPFAVFEAGRW